MTKEQSHTH